jgi:hypothetical protein
MDSPRPSQQTLADFLQWREAGRLQITPKFQRRGVWTPKQRSYFIDTMLQSYPAPPLYFRNVYDIEKNSVVHEVVDGQQRIRTILDYFDGHYAIAGNLDVPYGGLKYGQLSKDQKLTLMTYKFNCETFEAISDREVIGVFRRMNTYSTPLSAQELRHGRFFGPFRQACEGLAEEHLEFWRTNKIVSEKKISRMMEVQLTSEILISQMDGLQDKTKSIDEFYDGYEEKFPGRKKYEKNFRKTVDEITETLGDTLVESQFRSPTFFYTLFGAVYHRTVGMPNIVGLRTPKKPLKESERDSLRSAVAKLSRIIASAKSEQKLDRQPEEKEQQMAIPTRLRPFANACTSQTDNLKPRQVRLETLYREAFSCQRGCLSWTQHSPRKLIHRYPWQRSRKPCSFRLAGNTSRSTILEWN